MVPVLSRICPVGTISYSQISASHLNSRGSARYERGDVSLLEGGLGQGFYATLIGHPAYSEYFTAPVGGRVVIIAYNDVRLT
jgi:hypothetical protein